MMMFVLLQLFTYTGEFPLPPSSSSRGDRSSPTNSSGSLGSAGSGGKMGNSHGGGGGSKAAVLSDEDLNFIARNTALSRQAVDERYAHFLERHPDGKISKKEFRHMMQVNRLI